MTQANQTVNEKKDVPAYEKPETEQGYYKSLVELLDHYEDGWKLMIDAHKAGDYDYPLTRKPEHKDNPYIPDNWLELADKVIQIIAKEKYELDVYPNEIQIVRADQMLDVYTTVGLPNSYRHWSFGKNRENEERKYDSSKHLAYELIINSDPCIAYCMDTNSPLMQMTVIGHASYGHNTVFKNNYLFKGFTEADTILIDNIRMRDYVYECEQKYGWEEVSAFLDFCHAMQFIDTSDEMKKRTLRKSELIEREKQRRLNAHLHPPKTSVFNLAAKEQDNAPAPGKNHPKQGEKNILEFMADHAPHLPEWKRNIMKMRANISRYFKPQMMSKVVHEGMATFIEEEIMTTMRDIGLIDYAMWAEYNDDMQGVIFQPPGFVTRKHPQTGEEYEQFVGSRMNPYTLGFKILQEIKRVCKDPTEEDKKWFPHMAGDPDWLPRIKQAVFNCSDETLIAQYLTPQAIRDFKMFSVKDCDEDDVTEEDYEKFPPYQFPERFKRVTAVQSGEGFKHIRDVLASNYRISDIIPNVSLHDYQERTDRCLVLRHHMMDEQFLDANDTQLVLEHMHRHWGHPVVIESVNEKGEVLDEMSSPPDYDYRANRLDPQHELGF